MRSARLVGPSQVEIEDIDEPELSAGSVIVEVGRCLIGGADIESYRTGQPVAPAWFGHEWVGTVVAVADGVRGRFRGERVVGAAPPPCGRCAPCLEGLAEHCDQVLSMILGLDQRASLHGGFSERIRVDARRVRRVPEAIDLGDAAMAEPVAVAAHSIRRAGQAPGDMVVVIGAGTIGLITVQLAQLSGAARVLLIDPDPDRCELGCDLGSDAALAGADHANEWMRSRGHRLGADVVYDCSGDPSSMGAGLSMARRGGTLVAVGISGGSSELTTRQLITSEITLVASLGYSIVDCNRSLDLIAEEKLVVDRLYEPDPVPLDDFPALIAELASVPAGRAKYQIAPGLGK